jgi:hypothetical protein
MRTWVAVAFLVACGGGDGAIDQSGDAGGGNSDTVSSNSDASQLPDTMSTNSGGTDGTTPQGGAAGAGTGGTQNGGAPGGTSGSVGTGGVVGTGGSIAIDPLEPYPFCGDYTAFRIPRQTCVVVRGRFTIGPTPAACGAVGGEPKVFTCVVHAHLDRTIRSEPVTAPICSRPSKPSPTGRLRSSATTSSRTSARRPATKDPPWQSENVQRALS